MEVFKWDDTVISKSVVISNNQLFYGNRSAKIKCLNLIDSTVLWEFQLTENLYIQPLIIDGKIVLAVEKGDLFVLDRTSGDLLFKYQFKARIKTKFQSFQDLIIMSVRGQGVFTFNISTFEINRVLRSSSEVTSTDMLLHEGKLIVGDLDQRLVSFDLISGKELWATTFENSLLTAPIVVDNFVYVGVNHLLDSSKSFITKLKIETGREVEKIYCIIDSRFSIKKYNDALLLINENGIISVNLNDFSTRVFHDGNVFTEMLVSNKEVYFGTRDRKLYANTFISKRVVNSFKENFSDPFEYSGSVYLVSNNVLYKVINN